MSRLRQFVHARHNAARSDRAQEAESLHHVTVAERQGKHTIDRFNGSGFAVFNTIDGITTVPFLADRLGCQMEEL